MHILIKPAKAGYEVGGKGKGEAPGAKREKGNARLTFSPNSHLTNTARTRARAKTEIDFPVALSRISDFPRTEGEG